MSRLHITVDTLYYGDPLTFVYDIDQESISDKCEEACEKAFARYESLPENADVSSAELYASVSILEISYMRLS